MFMAAVHNKKILYLKFSTYFGLISSIEKYRLFQIGDTTEIQNVVYVFLQILF